MYPCQEIFSSPDTVFLMLLPYALQRKDSQTVSSHLSAQAPSMLISLATHFLSSLNLQDKKSLFVLDTNPKNFVTLSARNLKNVRVMNAASVNTYELLKANKLVFSETAIKELDAMLANS